MSHDPTDKMLDQALGDYVDRAEVSPHALANMQSSVLSQLEEPNPDWMSWLTQTWWRPLLAGTLPLVFGFVVGINSNALDADLPDIAGIVYFDGLEDISLDEF